MLFAGSYCVEWNNPKGETLDKMVKDENKIQDVEEGEISDTASVEEISEEDFKKQEVKVQESKPKGDSRVWTMRDLYKYPSFRGYASGLYNLAWAQAVQNKPLNEIFVMDVEDENSKRSSPSSSVASVNSKEVKGIGKEVDKTEVVDSGDEMDVNLDVEKEEGELEEGEIDLDSEPAEKPNGECRKGHLSCSDRNVDGLELDFKEELEKRVNSIREALESITLTEAGISFEGVCSKFQSTLESFEEVGSKLSVSAKFDLIQLSLTAVQALSSVLSSMNPKLKEENKGLLSRLLYLVKSQNPPLFSKDQMKEIEMALSLGNPDVSFCARASDTEKILDEVNMRDSGTLAADCTLEVSSSNVVHDKPNTLSKAWRSAVSRLKRRGISLPLLDLHKDHDLDSLPSPTRETTPCLPVHRSLAGGDGLVKSVLTTSKAPLVSGEFKMHPYETDAVKAVSTYQQKFGRNSFLSDRLPSPTPSEESGDGDGDINGEVSSSTVGNFKPTIAPLLGAQPVLSSPPYMNSSIIQGLNMATNGTNMSLVSNSTAKASNRSRDPRLRFANPDASALDLNQQSLPVLRNVPRVESVGGIMSSKKQKAAEELLLDGPSMKRQKNGLEDSEVKHVKTASGSGGWLEDYDVVGPQIVNRNQSVEPVKSNPMKVNNIVSCPSTDSIKPNAVGSGNELSRVTCTGTTASLPALLKDIAVNPTMLINLLKMGQQQRLEAEFQQKSIDPLKNALPCPSTSSVLGAIPSVNIAPSNPAGILPKPAGILQDDLGKVRMKPRDPRRVLHGNVLQRTGSSGSEQVKTNGPPRSSSQGSKDRVNTHIQGHEEMKQIPLQSAPLPDITNQFTKNLKNIADIVSVSQALPSQPVVSQNTSSQTMQIELDSVDAKCSISSPEDQQTRTGSAPDVGKGGPSHSQNTWGDFEHLFEGYDDKQRAAIQRERARRLEEQKKMFAARKLCLVLDLDHTLLNSAKFVEVDTVHDEILRKKEEQDREKPHRHLFRFSHMGMWTKLRPGIWNFLEKASKLYELHLYTMGNKLYATEMAKVLDPKGVLFSGRVISRGDDGEPFDGDERVPKSKDLEGVLGMESAVVIIDDSVRVWPHNKLNLIVVERYTYFPCSRRQFGLPGPSLLEIDHDERPEDGTLASSLAVIERIHQNFFSRESLDDVDVRNILASEQQRILAGCRIVFSRVFPVGEANPQLHPLWQTAEQFGAVCTNQIDDKVTHVVANSLGTDKVNWAISNGKHVVHPGWVEASALLYRRANEQEFAIKP